VQEQPRGIGGDVRALETGKRDDKADLGAEIRGGRVKETDGSSELRRARGRGVEHGEKEHAVAGMNALLDDNRDEVLRGRKWAPGKVGEELWVGACDAEERVSVLRWLQGIQL
jgi:hypothetical protein